MKRRPERSDLFRSMQSIFMKSCRGRISDSHDVSKAYWTFAAGWRTLTDLSQFNKFTKEAHLCS